MTAQQKAIFTIVYFLVMLIPSYFSRRKIWEAVCKAGGTTPHGVREKQAELLRTGTSNTLQTRFEVWMTQNAPDPRKFRLLFRFYQLCLAPNIIFAFMSFNGLYSHALDTILKIGMVVVPVIILVGFGFGIWYDRHENL